MRSASGPPSERPDRAAGEEHDQRGVAGRLRAVPSTSTKYSGTKVSSPKNSERARGDHDARGGRTAPQSSSAGGAAPGGAASGRAGRKPLQPRQLGRDQQRHGRGRHDQHQRARAGRAARRPGVTSAGPSAKPALPPSENRLIPVARREPER